MNNPEMRDCVIRGIRGKIFRLSLQSKVKDMSKFYTLKARWSSWCTRMILSSPAQERLIIQNIGLPALDALESTFPATGQPNLFDEFEAGCMQRAFGL